MPVLKLHLKKQPDLVWWPMASIEVGIKITFQIKPCVALLFAS